MAAAPASEPISFAHEDESLSARFQVTPPAQVTTGEYTLRAVVTSPATGDEKFSAGYQVIEYPHIQRRQVIKPAEVEIRVIDVKTTPGISVGYINGAGDQVPEAIEQLGAKLTFIDQDELAGGDLSKYNVIVTGVRAYERRADLRAYNQRLLDYAARGGTVIVQYNKMEFNQAQYGPYPAKVSKTACPMNRSPSKFWCRMTRSSITRTLSGQRPGLGGCRNAVSTFSAKKTENTSIWYRWWIRSRTIPE